ncbi:MAG: cysteine desulfurase family protein [Thiobacillus sp.]|jgi:cysteine desulfurase|uniref:cysteine desulfurase family protein n=1 Tax=Thiobacillus sp. TaxID=924 RepID=UPI002893C92F|nr:cysteine desulfurase family protein [Thiobacillus sp.]MDT3707904.1 cysteine desulfurase family protein [Thiobacillus sp.]
MSDPVYLDCNATTPVDPRVLEAMLPYLAVHYGNPSSDHVYGQRAKAAVEAARAEVAALIGASPAEIVFTGCATEANNLALLGAARAALPSGRTALVTSSVEHPSVLNPLRHLAREGRFLTELPVDAFGRVQLNHAAAVINPEVALVSVMLANNESGSLQAVREIADLAHAVGAWMHVDAAQAVGKVTVDVNALGADLLTLAGHKFYAPKGVGALYVRTGVTIEPIQYGAGHEHGLRPGTENVPHIVAMGEAARLARTTLVPEATRMTSLRDRLHGLLDAAIPGLQLNGHPTERLPNTLNISFPSATGWQVLAAAPTVAASTGSACHAGDHAVSGVLAAMGLTPAAAAGAVRLSLGRFTTEGEIDAAAQALISAWISLTE